MNNVYMVWEDNSDLRAIFGSSDEAIHYAKELWEDYILHKWHMVWPRVSGPEEVAVEKFGRYTVERYSIPWTEDETEEIWPEDEV